jgi:hypothetical protein
LTGHSKKRPKTKTRTAEGEKHMASEESDAKSSKRARTSAAGPESSTVAPAPVGAQRQATIRYVDRPDIAETFVDSVTGLVFDGQTLRVEFAVTRLDEVKANAPITGRRYPACRLVLPPAAAVDLINRMQQIGTALAQAGLATRAVPRTGDTMPTD